MKLYLSSYRLGNRPELLRELVGGNTRTAVIMNAADEHTSEERQERLEREIADLTSIGLQVAEVDLRDYFQKPDDMAKALEPFDLVWVRGGNTFVLRRAMACSGFDDAIRDRVHDDTIMYGGYSAGTIVATPTLRGVELVDDPDEIPKGYPSEIVWDGMGFVNFSIAPHYQSPHPESPAVSKVVACYEEHRMPYKTLHDGEVIIVNGDSVEVVS